MFVIDDCDQISMRVRAAIVQSVYSKSLTISSAAKRAFTSGQITNIMAVDTSR